MRVRIRGKTGELRRFRSFAFSFCVHGAVLGFVAISSGMQSEPQPSLYDMKIRPYEHKLIWYSLKKRVPDVRPADSRKTSRPPRAVRKFDQSLIAGKREDLQPAQKVWVPEPPKVEMQTPKVEPLPNLLAVAPAPKRPLRTFQPPAPQPVKVKPAPAVPDAPEALAKFTAVTPKELPIDLKLPRPMKAFVPPPSLKPTARKIEPELVAPEAQTKFTVVTPKNLAIDMKIPRPMRAFVPPPPIKAATPTTAIELAAPPEAPMAAAPVSEASMAIVGLDPAKTIEIPKPPAPRDANFSAGPKPNPNGESAPPSNAMLSVPGLYAHGGPKDLRPSLMAGLAPLSQKNLMAAMRLGNAERKDAETQAMRVTGSPDPRMDGRVVYTMAIQMQNITSYSGSWMVWFAEHQPLPGAPPRDMRPPDPMRKVDPRYIADAVLEHVEGIVRLSAVIRKDGHVDSVEVLKHLDERLDKSAEEALRKWQFEPARRDGAPVDVDAVFEIPFRLAPRSVK